MKALRTALSLILLTLVVVMVLLARGHRATASPNATEQKLWSVYWTTEPGYRSNLVMKNNRAKETVIVYPSLYFRDGQEYPLVPVTLSPRQTTVVNLNEIVAAARGSSSQRMEGTLELSFSAANEAAIGGDISVTNEGKGIAWNFRLYPPHRKIPAGPVRGLFWLPGQDSKGLVAVQNASEEFITVKPQIDVATGTYPLPSRRIDPGQGFTLDLRDALKDLQLNDVEAGGIEFNYDGPRDALKADGVLFDERGFSTQVDFLPYQPNNMGHDLALRTPQFAIGPVDPKLGLPSGSLFEPTIVLHNFDSAPLNATLEVGYRVGIAPAAKQLHVSLSAGETRVLALYPLLKDVVPKTAHWASLEVQYTSKQNALAASLVSVNRAARRSIRSVLNWVMGSASDGPLWQADDAHSTMIAIFNADTEPAHVDVSLDYYDGTERRKHKLTPLTIPPRVTEQIDVGAVLAGGEPDADGDTIPPDVTFGGYRVQKVGRHIDKVLITEALVFDRQKQSYLTFYNTCCAFFNLTFGPSSVLGVPGDTGQLDIQALDSCGGNTVDVTSSGSFSTVNGAIATVGANNGLASLVHVGQTTLDSEITYFTKDDFLGSCSTTSDGSTTPANVTTVTFSGPSYVVVGQTATLAATVAPTNNTTPISLSIDAAASVVSPTGTFTATTSVVVKGLTAGNATLTATIANPEGDSPIPVGSTIITVTSATPTAVVTQRTSGTVSTDNSRSGNYQSAVGTTSLGPLIANGFLTGCLAGNEDVGTITPSNYTGMVILHRFIIKDATYTNSTSTGGLTSQDDTAQPQGRDDDPQSGGSGGKVYDVDAPGATPPNADGKTYRYRGNFYAYAALPDGTKISSNYNFYVRISCTKTSSGFQFVNDVTGDNQIGPGTTATTWNLQ